jgi:hypothetical protein
MIRIIFVVSSIALAVMAQGPPKNIPGVGTVPAKITKATPQQAQTVTIPISADLATALETARLNQRLPNGQPQYANITAFVTSLLRPHLRDIVEQYQPASFKAKKDAATKAASDAAAAENAVLPQ